MKKIIIAAITVLLLSSCGVGSYSVTSGKADVAAISFTSTSIKSKTAPITVTVDGTAYEVSCVKDVAWKTDRNIKKTAKNTISLTPGTHKVTVILNGAEVYSQTVFLSTRDHKIIEL